MLDRLSPIQERLVKNMVAQWSKQFLNGYEPTLQELGCPKELESWLQDAINQHRFYMSKVNGGKCPCILCEGR
jgi:hypothetical protein